MLNGRPLVAGPEEGKVYAVAGLLLFSLVGASVATSAGEHSREHLHAAASFGPLLMQYAGNSTETVEAGSLSVLSVIHDSSRRRRKARKNG